MHRFQGPGPCQYWPTGSSKSSLETKMLMLQHSPPTSGRKAAMPTHHGVGWGLPAWARLTGSRWACPCLASWGLAGQGGLHWDNLPVLIVSHAFPPSPLGSRGPVPHGRHRGDRGGGNTQHCASFLVPALLLFHWPSCPKGQESGSEETAKLEGKREGGFWVTVNQINPRGHGVGAMALAGFCFCGLLCDFRGVAWPL